MTVISNPQRAARTSQLASILKRTAVVLVGISLFSRLLGLLREAVIASYFGAGPDTDAFFAAFRIPDLLFNSLLTFLIGTSVIPVVAAFLVSRDERGARDYTRALLAMTVAVLLPAVVLLAAFSREFVALLAPGLLPQSAGLTARMTRIMAPIILLGGLTGVAKAALEARRRFLVPATIPLLYNVCVILAAVLLARQLGVSALALGVLAAALAQAILLLLVLGTRYGIGEGGGIRTQRAALEQTGRILWPTVLALFVGNIVPVVEVNLASRLAPGAISYLSFASRLEQIPEQILAVALATVLFPALSAAAARGDNRGLVGRLSGGIRLSFFLMLPISVLLGAFSVPIIKLLFGRGAFHAESVAGSAAALTAYSVGLAAVCAKNLLVSAFFALQDSRTLLKVTAVMVLFNVALDLILMGWLESAGLALGAALTGCVQLSVLFVLLKARLGDIDGARVLATLRKAGFASAIMLLALLPLRGFGTWPGWGPSQPLALLAVVATVGGLVYAGVLRLVKGEEMRGLGAVLHGGASVDEAPSGATERMWR